MTALPSTRWFCETLLPWMKHLTSLKPNGSWKLEPKLLPNLDWSGRFSDGDVPRCTGCCSDCDFTRLSGPNCYRGSFHVFITFHGAVKKKNNSVRFIKTSSQNIHGGFPNSFNPTSQTWPSWKSYMRCFQNSALAPKEATLTPNSFSLVDKSPGRKKGGTAAGFKPAAHRWVFRVASAVLWRK